MKWKKIWVLKSGSGSWSGDVGNEAPIAKALRMFDWPLPRHPAKHCTTARVSIIDNREMRPIDSTIKPSHEFHEFVNYKENFDKLP
jgi:uncharacterized protein YukJ